MSKENGKSSISSARKEQPLERVMRDLFAVQPDAVQGQLVVRTEFYKQVLFRKVMTVFDIEGAPDGFDVEWFFRHIYNYGYTVVAATSAFGVVPVEGAMEGYNLYGYPTQFTTSNPLIVPDEVLSMPENAVLIFLSNIAIPNGGWLFKGAMEMIRIYAEKLASLDAGIDVNIMNSKVAYVFNAENEAQAQTAKRIYDDITSGKPAVFIREKNTINMKSDGSVNTVFGNVKNNYIVDLLNDAKRVVMNEFLTLIGIDNAPVDKKERVQNAETNSNNYEVFNAVEDWERNLKNGIELCNKNLGTNMRLVRTVDKWQQEVNKNEAADINGFAGSGRDTIRRNTGGQQTG